MNVYIAIRKQLECRCLDEMCDDASHDASHIGKFNTAYESQVDRLRACSRDFYIKKQVNGIAGWSKKLYVFK